MEEFGFGFFHPLETLIPQSLEFLEHDISFHEKPYWKIRGIHYHTEHPLELTNFFQGWGKNGTEDVEGWNEMFSEYKKLLGIRKLS